MLYRKENPIPRSVIDQRNEEGLWKYGRNSEYDVVIISKDGTIGDVYEIEGLLIALPDVGECHATSEKKEDQYWKRFPFPKAISSIKTTKQWNERTIAFKQSWTGYINEEFDRRENGLWFMNCGVPTYITGSHYFYLQWASIDVGYPDYREANRILWIYWEACKADPRSYGMDYVKIRRSGLSFMAASEAVNIGSLARNSKVGMMSKTGKDAQSLFSDKVVPINTKLPFFFRPIMDGMTKPKTEILYRVPATKITKSNMDSASDDEDEGLNTIIDWRSTANSSYDSEKLKYIIEDEAGKWLAPNNIEEHWGKIKTCLRLGAKIVGKCMMGSTVESASKGGEQFKKIWDDSDPRARNDNGNTPSGLYRLFIPMEWNYEGAIDRYGWPVFYPPSMPKYDSAGEPILIGAITAWENEIEGLRHSPEKLNEHYRQYPRVISHAFRNESLGSLFDLVRIYDQIEINDAKIIGHELARGNFRWKNGVPDSEVEWIPSDYGRFLVGWIPRKELQNKYVIKEGRRTPDNMDIGAFGCDSYDISAVSYGRGSKGALSGLTKFHIHDAPTDEFFLEYCFRPDTSEEFFEDVLMTVVFYGMQVLVENNKPRLLYHLKNRGYRGYSMTRPDRAYTKLSKAEIELGGIPSSSDTILTHASAIESYINKHVGYDRNGTYRNETEPGRMFFSRTLMDWEEFDITDRTKHDLTISSGLAIMACNRHLYTPIQDKKPIILNFAKFNNSGSTSTYAK